MKILELLTEQQAPQALEFAIKNTIASLRKKVNDEDKPAVRLAIQVELDRYKKLLDLLDNRANARMYWKSMSSSAKKNLPMTQHIRDYLVEGGSGSGRPSEGKRSKKNLWFERRDLWLTDLRNLYPGADFDMLTTDKSTDGDLFVVDQTHKQCYGCWRTAMNKGISFNKPRPLHIVVGHRVKLARMVDAPTPKQLQ